MEPPVVLIDALRAVYVSTCISRCVKKSATRGTDTISRAELPASVADDDFVAPGNSGWRQALAACRKRTDFARFSPSLPSGIRVERRSSRAHNVIHHVGVIRGSRMRDRDRHRGGRRSVGGVVHLRPSYPARASSERSCRSPSVRRAARYAADRTAARNERKDNQVPGRREQHRPGVR